MAYGSWLVTKLSEERLRDKHKQCLRRRFPKAIISCKRPQRDSNKCDQQLPFAHVARLVLVQRTARSSTNAVYILIALGRVFRKVNTCADGSVSLFDGGTCIVVHFSFHCEDKIHEQSLLYSTGTFRSRSDVHPCVSLPLQYFFSFIQAVLPG